MVPKGTRLIICDEYHERDIIHNNSHVPVGPIRVYTYYLKPRNEKGIFTMTTMKIYENSYHSELGTRQAKKRAPDKPVLSSYIY